MQTSVTAITIRRLSSPRVDTDSDDFEADDVDVIHGDEPVKSNQHPATVTGAVDLRA